MQTWQNQARKGADVHRPHPRTATQSPPRLILTPGVYSIVSTCTRKFVAAGADMCLAAAAATRAPACCPLPEPSNYCCFQTGRVPAHCTAHALHLHHPDARGSASNTHNKHAGCCWTPRWLYLRRGTVPVHLWHLDPLRVLEVLPAGRRGRQTVQPSRRLWLRSRRHRRRLVMGGGGRQPGQAAKGQA